MKAIYISSNEEFSQRLLNNVCKNLDLDCVHEPGVYLDGPNTSACAGAGLKHINGRTDIVAKNQGANIAHWNVWNKIKDMSEERVIVLEADAFLPYKKKENMSLAVNKVNEYLSALDETVDVAYLGHLKHKLGAHAYAITPNAAKNVAGMGGAVAGI